MATAYTGAILKKQQQITVLALEKFHGLLFDLFIWFLKFSFVIAISAKFYRR